MKGRGSRQLRSFLRAIRAGDEIESAADQAGISIREARLHLNAEQEGEYTDIDISEPMIGHNSGDNMSNGNVAADQLRLFIERYERLDEETKGLAADKKDVLLEAKSQGYDPATMRRVIKLRAMDRDKRDEASALLETYCAALGMQGSFAL